MDAMEIDDVNNNTVEPMEVDEDVDLLHYAKLYLHKEVTSRDAKIGELLTQIEDCHQDMHFIQSRGRLLELQRELSQQIEAHQQTKDSMAFKNTTCEFLRWRVHQQNEEYCKLEAKFKSDERMLEEATLKTKQCDELLVQLRRQAEECRKLESKLKCDGRNKFAKDAIMKKLVDETKSLTSMLHDQQQQMRDMAQYGKNDSAVFDKQKSMNGFERMIKEEHRNFEDLQQRRNMNDAPSGMDTPSILSHVNPFKEENVQKKAMENDANTNKYYKHAKYEKDCALELGSNTLMQNPFKCDTMGQKADVVVDRRNKEQTSKVHTPFKKPPYFVTSKAKYERDLEKELGSNTPMNPFEPFSVVNNKERPPNTKRPAAHSKTYVKRHAVDTKTYMKRPTTDSKTYVKRPAVDTKTYVKRPTADSKTYVKRPAVDTKTYVKRPTADSKLYVKHTADNTKTWLKRRADHNQWETDSNDFKKPKIAEENHQHRQQQHQDLKSIPNGKGGQNFNPFKGGKQGAVAGNENARKTKIRRDGPYNHSNSTEGIKV